MARKIIPLNEVEENEEQTEEQKVAQDIADAKETTSQATLACSECIISQDEMERVLNEWTITGKGDLVVDPTIAERLKRYIAYQEELDPLREKLAKRLYMPFSCEFERAADWKKVRVYINDSNDGYDIVLSSRYQSDAKVYVKLCDFKEVLASIGNPYAKYISEESKTRVNIVAFIKSIGGDVEIDSFNIKISNV